MAAHIVKPELLAQEIGQRASVNELAAVIQQPGDIRNGRRLRQRPLDLVLRVHAASMRCARSIVQLYLRVKGRASDEAEGRPYGFLRQVWHDSKPSEEGLLRRIEAGSRQALRKSLPFEIDRSKD